jgi:hypothetical protein
MKKNSVFLRRNNADAQGVDDFFYPSKFNPNIDPIAAFGFPRVEGKWFFYRSRWYAVPKDAVLPKEPELKRIPVNDQDYTWVLDDSLVY